jgi:diaminohydroxyphosphoribosylaminopyrimidine deaminase/5-amino-6-(5-phosphoribosylamino)uracil reductase
LPRNDEKFMREALRLARRGLGRTSPNPAVGALIVRKGKVVASGYHRMAGGRHAEAAALESLGGKARKGDTLYVTLEPCNHFGRTPPCTEAIVRSGLGKVVVGMKDPNPAVAGGGCEFLRDRGIEVKTGVLEADCRRLNEIFIKFITTGRPFVIAKSAMTLDGWTATSTGHSKWVSGERSRAFVHRLRDRVDGVMVGVGTVIADNPRLTARLPGRKGRDPVRVIADTHLRTPQDAWVLNHDSPARTLVAVGETISAARRKRLSRKGVSFLACNTRGGSIDMAFMMDRLGEQGITSLLVEGGATLLGRLIREKMIDKFHIFKAPKILGGNDGVSMASGTGPLKMDDSLRLRDVRIQRFGCDTLFTGYPDYGNPES